MANWISEIMIRWLSEKQVYENVFKIAIHEIYLYKQSHFKGSQHGGTKEHFFRVGNTK